MNKDDDTVLDKIILIMRRLFVLLFIGVLIWILFSKVIGPKLDKQTDDTLVTGQIVDTNVENNSNNNNNNNNNKDKQSDMDQDGITIIDLGKNYESQSGQIMYKGKVVQFADVDSFYVLDKNKEYQTTNILINSNNLLKIFANYDTRAYMMKQIDSIIETQQNTTKELKGASENGMYKMKDEYDDLAQFNWNDRYDMTNEQRAKFAIMFLYIKILKSMNNNQISMEVAKTELKYFLENFDKSDLEDEVDDKDMNRIRGDIGLDDYCIYKNGELYACFLNKIFVK